MEVINPEIEEIDGILYRVNFSNDYNAVKDAETTPYIEFGEENEIECAREVVDDEECDVKIDYLNDGRFQISFHVPKTCFPHLIGVRGGTKQRLEAESRSFIHIPKQGENGDVVITGCRREDVLCAYRRIKVLVATHRSKQPLTHFISLPMLNSNIINNFQRFKQDVLSNCPNIDENLFTSPGQLHITSGVMTLADDEERASAIDAFISSKQYVVDPILKRKSIRVHVRGLDCMNDDYSKVRVLFAKIENNPARELLQQLADSMVHFFVNKGIAKKEREHVKLHITLMNSRFLETNGDKRRKKNSFDATTILQMYKDYDFGEVEINSIHLSQMHTEADDGYYLASCKMTIY